MWKIVFMTRIQPSNGLRKATKIIFLVDFNARVGRNHNILHGVTGHQGVGNMNSSGLRLLSLLWIWSGHHKYLLPPYDMHKTYLVHPRYKHWHLIDYVIVRPRDLIEMLITRAMREAECSTDRRLIRSTLRLTVRPPARSEWKLPLRGRITYWHCRQPKLPNFIYSSNCLFGGRCRQCYSDILLQCARDVEADHTDSGIAMDCADRNRETPHLGDWWGELTATTCSQTEANAWTQCACSPQPKHQRGTAQCHCPIFVPDINDYYIQLHIKPYYGLAGTFFSP